MKLIINALVSNLFAAIVMKKNYRSALSRIRTLFTRALACVLFVGIVYSATFGVVHSHLNASFLFDAKVSASAAAQAGASEMPLRRSSDGSECLVCALHRDFSSSTVHASVFLVGPSSPITTFNEPPVFYYSVITSSRPLIQLSGRAPPLRLA